MLKGPTRRGRNNTICPFASIGAEPPASAGTAAALLIGTDNVLREGVTIERGTHEGRARTLLGDHNVLLARVHVAHDCALGHHVTLSNNTSIGGHGTVGDGANVGGHALVTKSRRIGAHARVEAMSLVVEDVPAFTVVRGHPAAVVEIDVSRFDDSAASALRVADSRSPRRTVG
jgi:UDP-N-acetylglucosamine acyltransferase